MKILDCNVMLASHAEMVSIENYRLEYGLNYCALRSEYAQMYHPTDGNALLAQRINDFSALYPVYTAGTPEGGDFPPVSEFISEAQQAGAVGIYFHPPTERLLHSASPWSMGEYYEVLAQTGLPMMIKAEDIAPHVVYEICQLQPELQIVLLDIHYSLAKELYALLPVTQHLYLETSGLRGYRMIADICQRFGAHRLVFGSRYPLYEPGAALADLYYADISDDARQSIAFNELVFGSVNVQGGTDNE